MLMAALPNSLCLKVISWPLRVTARGIQRAVDVGQDFGRLVIVLVEMAQWLM
jgi:hypothetical protein